MKTCLRCGKTIGGKPGIVAVRLYCSRRCYGANRADRKKTPVSRTCQQCGKSFPRKNSAAPGIFCSRRCLHDSQTKRIACRCEHCGKECNVPPNRASYFRFCSHRCRAYALCVGKTIAVKIHEEDDPFAYYRTPGWIKRAGRIRKRDSYKCRHCGKQFEKGAKTLGVHHIVPRRNGGSDHDGNLISLCMPCHTKEDARLRKADFSRGEFRQRKRKDAGQQRPGTGTRGSFGIGRVPPSKKLSDADIERIRSLYRDGMSGPEIVKSLELPVSGKTAWKIAVQDPANKARGYIRKKASAETRARMSEAHKQRAANDR